MSDRTSVEAVRVDPSWKQFAEARHAYGLLLTLAYRPMSRGNQLALVETKSELDELFAGISNNGTTSKELALAAAMHGALGGVPVESVARTMVGGLETILRSWTPTSADLPVSYVARAPHPMRCRRALVTIGPTIGVGDELLVARALVERCQVLGDVDLRVATRRPSIWRALDSAVGELGPPPLGALTHLAELDPTERAHTSYAFVDFLDSDPSPTLYEGPPGTAFAGRWIMGSQEGAFASFDTGMAYRAVYPPGLPDNRWLESRWAAARIVPGRGAAAPLSPRPRGPSGPTLEVAVQVLTSKPPLLLPAAFYAAVLGTLSDRARNRSVRVTVVAAPIAQGSEVVHEVVTALRSTLGESRVSLSDPLDLGGVTELIARSDLLIGPDTFTAHLAAMLGVPQVVVSLPQHLAWISPHAPIIAIPYRGDPATLVPEAVRGLRLMSEPELPATAGLREAAARWNGCLDRLDDHVRRYLHGEEPDVSTAAADIAVAREVHRAHRGAVLALVGEPEWPTVGLYEVDPLGYTDLDDAQQAITRWFAALGSSNFSGLLTAVRHVA